jgi:hypothetical protein
MDGRPSVHLRYQAKQPPVAWAIPRGQTKLSLRTASQPLTVQELGDARLRLNLGQLVKRHPVAKVADSIIQALAFLSSSYGAYAYNY